MTADSRATVALITAYLFTLGALTAWWSRRAQSSAAADLGKGYEALRDDPDYRDLTNARRAARDFLKTSAAARWLTPPRATQPQNSPGAAQSPAAPGHLTADTLDAATFGLRRYAETCNGEHSRAYWRGIADQIDPHISSVTRKR